MSSYSFYEVNENIDMTQNALEYYEYFVIDATNNIEIILPQKDAGYYYQFHRITGNGTITLIPQTGELVNELTNFEMNNYIQLIKIGNEWFGVNV